ncbi:hypothetical protein H4R19_000550 [Coemansia spiralis]|nr:hypothetical protein H4R19_000550 [Coemansia spiralis]
MPRVTRMRTKCHAAAAAPPAKDIVSAPVPLSSAEDGAAERPSGKKAKRVARHKQWIEKLDAAQTAQRQQRKKQARAADKSALIRGMDGMQQSLREVQAQVLALDMLAPQRPAVAVTNSKHNTIVSRKARNKAARAEEKRFGQVLRHPAFHADPLATIREHLANTLGTASAPK